MGQRGKRQYGNRGRDQINIDRVDGNVLLQSQETVRPLADRDLLEAVRQLVESRLKAQLHHHVKLNLSKETQPEQVPWGMEVKVAIAQSSQLLPPETTIAQVFDQCSSRLLILGEPGAGKTTSLLDLALELVARAEADSQQRIPVVVDLSDWQPTAPEATSMWGRVAFRRAGFSQKNHPDDRPEQLPAWSIADWLVAKVREKYGFTPQQVGQWLAEKQLVPLLDGLDEVRPDYQQQCVKAINEWLNSDLRPRQVALCCRREQYEAYPEKLKLEGAVYLQDLTDEQIQTFLQKANRAELWESLVADANLLALIRRPLLLSIAVLAYGELDPIQWRRATSANARLNLLLDAYVQRMLMQDTDSRFYRKGKIPSVEQRRKWLEMLALQLLQGSQTEFLIEKMQPIWLSTSLQKWMYVLTMGIFLGLIFGLSALGMGSIPSSFWFGLGMGVLSSLREGRLVWKDLKSIKSIGTLRISLSGLKPKKVLRKLSSSYFTILIPLLIIGVLIYKLVDPKLDFNLALICVLIYILTLLLIFLLIPEKGMNVNKVEILPIANQGIWNSLRNVIPTMLTLQILWTLGGGFVIHLNGHPVSPLSLQYILVLSSSLALWIWILMTGGNACIQHFTLRLCLSGAGSIPWNYARFLNYATERLLLQRVGGSYRFMHDLLRQSLAQSRIDTHPTLISSQALARCGESYRLMGQYDRALQNFDRAIELNPKNDWAIANRGETYQLMKRYKEALQDFDRAIELDSKDDWVIACRGETYLIIFHLNEALRDLNRAIKLDSKNDWYQYLRAITYLARNQSNAANTDLYFAICLAQQEHTEKPADCQNTFNLALYHLVAGNLPTAREFYQIALQHNPSPAKIREALRDLEDLLKVLGDVPDAKQMIDFLMQNK